MATTQPCSLHTDRLSRAMDLDAQRGDCLACRSQPLGIGTGGDQYLGEIDDAHQSARLLTPPVGEELARLGMVGVRAVEGADQDIGVENELQRSSSSESRRSRYPLG